MLVSNLNMGEIGACAVYVYLWSMIPTLTKLYISGNCDFCLLNLRMEMSTTTGDSSTLTTYRQDGDKDDTKPGILEFYKKLSCRSPLDEDLATEGKDTKEIDYWAAVDSFLSSVKPVRSEPVDVGDKAILQRFHSTTNFIKQYKEAMNDTKSDDDDDDDDDVDDHYDNDEILLAAAAEEEAEPLRETTDEAFRIHVPTVSAEAERLLRSARTLHKQTAELRPFLKGLLSEEGPGERVNALSCPELEETSVEKMFSPSRKIAEAKEELEIKEEYPVPDYPKSIQNVLNWCIQMGMGVDANYEQCSDLS